MLELNHLDTALQDGVYELNVMIEEKRYTYYLRSEYAYRRFLTYYRKGHHGKALKTLNQFKTIMEVTEDDTNQ